MQSKNARGNWAVADGPVTDRELALRKLSLETRNLFTITFDPADNGKTATYFARWAGRRGEMSNWSAPVSMTMAA